MEDKAHEWVEIESEYFYDISKCRRCGMTVENSDKVNWRKCDPEAF